MEDYKPEYSHPERHTAARPGARLSGRSLKSPAPVIEICLFPRGDRHRGAARELQVQSQRVPFSRRTKWHLSLLLSGVREQEAILLCGPKAGPVASERLVRPLLLASADWSSKLVEANSTLKVSGRAGAATVDLRVGLDLGSTCPPPPVLCEPPQPAWTPSELQYWKQGAPQWVLHGSPPGCRV